MHVMMFSSQVAVRRSVLGGFHVQLGANGGVDW